MRPCVAAVGTVRLFVIFPQPSEVETRSIQATLNYSWLGLLEVTALAYRPETAGLNLTLSCCGMAQTRNLLEIIKQFSSGVHLAWASHNALKMASVARYFFQATLLVPAELSGSFVQKTLKASVEDNVAS